MRVQGTSATRLTTERLTAALADVNSVHVLNWGSIRTDMLGDRVINRADAVALAARKGVALGLLQEDDTVNTPHTSFNLANALDMLAYGPVVGRKERHRQGQGLHVCRTEADVVSSFHSGCTHWLRWYEGVEREYRVHVIAGKVIKTSEKMGGSGSVRTHANGWRFASPELPVTSRRAVSSAAKAAVASLGLDIGAVDVIQVDGRPYVLEVNSAPSLTDTESTTFDKYVKWIKREWSN